MRKFFESLPKSTDRLTCPWYKALMYIALTLILMGATIIPDVYGAVAMVVGSASQLYLLYMRKDPDACAIN